MVAGQKIHIGNGHAGVTVDVHPTDATWRVYDHDQLLAEVPRTTSKPIARFKARKPEPPRTARPTKQNEPMPLDEHQLWQLLHALDDPDHLEFPADYNNRHTRERFERLVAASHHRLRLPMPG